jgi:DNA-binding CsgD family transcriptional regulator
MRYLNTLTQRENEVLARVSQGHQNKEIASTLHIAVHTVEQHLKHIYQKLEISNRTQASAIYWSHKNNHQTDGNPLYTAS